MKQPFLTLTLTDGKKVTINMSWVGEIVDDPNGDTVIASHDGVWRVKENAQTILGRLTQQNP